MTVTLNHFRLTQESSVKRELGNLKNLGFSYSSFGFKDLQTKKIVGCFSHQDWAEHYVSENLFSHDPLLQAACNIANHQILWSAVSIDSAEGYQVMMKRESISNVRFGVTLAINDGKFQEIIAIGDHDKETIFLDRFTKHFAKIMEVRKIIKNLLLGYG